MKYDFVITFKREALEIENVKFFTGTMIRSDVKNWFGEEGGDIIYCMIDRYKHQVMYGCNGKANNIIQLALDMEILFI